MEARRGRPPYPGILTPAEERVLELVRSGLTNAEIAIRLGLSISTVRYHLTNLHAKANSESRAALRSWQPSTGRRNPLGLLGPLVPALKWVAATAVVAGVGIAVVTTIATLSNGEETASPHLWPQMGRVFESPSGAPVIASQSRPALTKVTLGRGAFIDLSPDGARWAERGDVQTPFGIYLVSSDTERRPIHLSIVVDPGGNASIRRTPDGRAYFESHVDEAVEVGVYAALSTSREWLTTKMDHDGTVSLSPSPLPPDTVVDYASGAEVLLTDAATSLTLSPLTGNYWTTCSELCYVVWHREPTETITTPMDATLSCSSAGEVLLKSGALVLEMTSDSSESFYDACLAREGSTLSAGAPLSYSPWVGIKAFLNGQPADIVVTQDGQLRAGSATIGDRSCPCRVQP